MTLVGRSVARQTPGQLLAARSVVRGADPARSGPGWVALSEKYTELACVALASLSVAAVVAPNAAGGSPGRWIPAVSRLDLDGTLLPCAPDALDVAGDAEHRAAFAALHGVFWHEVGHAAHTRWRFDEVADELRDTVALLEEARMEAAVVRDAPSRATWLRAAARRLLLDGVDEVTTRKDAAAHMAALTLGRVAAGSLQPADVDPVRDWLAGALTADEIADVEALLAEVVTIADTDSGSLLDVARRWQSLFGDAGDAAGSGGTSKDEADGTDGSAGGSAGAGTELREDVRRVLEEVAAAAEAAAGDDLLDMADAAAEMTDVVTAARPKPATSPATADRKPDTAPRVHAHSADDRLAEWELRAPTGSEQAARRALAARLKVARSRERAMTVVPSAMPPGRLDSRGALKADAEASLGLMPTASPWRRRVRKTVPSPRLRLAVCTDVSGSMGWAADRISSAMWVLGQAVRDAGGEAVGAVFGGRATMVFDSRSTRMSSQVMDFDATASTEAIADCLELVDDALSLSGAADGVTESVVVIISDGHWVDPRQSKRADEWLQAASAKGIRTVLLGVGGGGFLPHPCDTASLLEGPDELVPVLGNALVAALRAKPATRVR